MARREAALGNSRHTLQYILCTVLSFISTKQYQNKTKGTMPLDTVLDSMYGCRYLYTVTGTIHMVNFVQPALISTKI
jgi:hypothetical protein